VSGRCPECGGFRTPVTAPVRFPELCRQCAGQHMHREILVAERADAAARALVPPPGMSIAESDESLEIEWRWFRAPSLTLLGGWAYWALIAMSIWGSVEREAPPLLFGLFALAVATPGYPIAAALLNRTHVAVGRRTLAVWHGPLPARRAVELPVADIQELVLLEGPRLRRHGPVTERWCSLVAICKDGRRVTLVPELSRHDDAVLLLARLQGFLRRCGPIR
jgi:hypothetical protein